MLKDKLGKLRAVENSELEMILSWRNDINVRSNMYTQHEISLEEHVNWWSKQEKDNSKNYMLYEFDGVPLGVVGFYDINQNHHTSSWAFYANPSAPKGTGSRMEWLALDYAFNTLKLNKLNCEVLDFNEKVIKLHKKFSFKEEGILREMYFINGRYTNVHCLGILASEWTQTAQPMADKLLKIFKL